jgi:hypothetical protein
MVELLLQVPPHYRIGLFDTRSKAIKLDVADQPFQVNAEDM